MELIEATEALEQACRETERLRTKFVETANATLPATPFGRTSMPELADPSGTGSEDHRGLSGVHPRTTVGSPGVWDSEFFKMKRDVHDALFALDQTAAQTLLRDPGKTNLFYGFDIPARSTPTNNSRFELDGLGKVQIIAAFVRGPRGAATLELRGAETDGRPAGRGNHDVAARSSRWISDRLFKSVSR